MFCSSCGNEIEEYAVICRHCGLPVNVKPAQADDSGLTSAYCILAILFPLFGIIYWAVKHLEAPKRARTVGICGLVAMIIYIAGIIAFTIFIRMLMGSHFY